MNTLITPDLIFSYWILAWTFIYYVTTPQILGLSSYAYESLNPSIGLWIALVYSVGEWIYLWNKSISWKILVKMLLIMFLIKIIPIFLLRKKKMQIRNNVLFIIGLYVIYTFYLYSKNTNTIQIYKKINESLTKNENKTPLMGIFSKISN